MQALLVYYDLNLGQKIKSPDEAWIRKFLKTHQSTLGKKLRGEAGRRVGRTGRGETENSGPRRALGDPNHWSQEDRKFYQSRPCWWNEIFHQCKRSANVELYSLFRVSTHVLYQFSADSFTDYTLTSLWNKSCILLVFANILSSFWKTMVVFTDFSKSSLFRLIYLTFYIVFKCFM